MKEKKEKITQMKDRLVQKTNKADLEKNYFKKENKAKEGTQKRVYDSEAKYLE